MRIPKIIHQIWIGPKEPPKFMYTWKNYHPDYEYILWDNENIKIMFPLINQHLYDQYDESMRDIWCGRCDLLRIEILYKYGGIYIDSDAICLRKMEGDFLEKDFFAVYLNEKARPGRLSNGVLGSERGHIVIQKYIEELNKNSKIFLPAFKFSGPVFFTKIVEDNNFNIIKLPSYYFLPNFFEKEEFNYKGDFKPFSDHHWGTTQNLYGNL